MFDNLIGQDEVRALLEGDIRAGRLPPSMLLVGPPASGKLTAALEIARVLSCESPEPGIWNCPCGSCVRHRALSHPDLLLFGRRSFPEEIPAALDTYAATPGKAGAFFFIRALRKLEKRFDPALWEGEESKLAKAAPLVAELEERLTAIDPSITDSGASGADRGAALKAAGELVAVAGKLESMAPDMPPVAQVRAAELWARLAPWGMRKTVVIENADAMNESSRNALLKILEEPPGSVSFVLLTSRRQAMMRTIMSRVRVYGFADRGAEPSREVLARVFRADVAQLEGSGPAILTPARWLASKRALPPEKARQLAASLIGAIAAERLAAGRTHGSAIHEAGSSAAAEGIGIAIAVPAILGATKDLGQKDDSFSGAFEAVLSACEELFGEILRTDDLLPEDLAWLAAAADLARETRIRRESFNLPAPTLLETLSYRLRDLGNGAPA